MGYEGPRLADLFAAAKPITKRAAREIAKDSADHWRDVTRRNTPIERFLKRVDTSPPYHLRNSWQIKDLKIIHLPEHGNDDVLETGVYTEVEYAPYVEEGTGLWGPEHRKYRITPKKPGGWLSWIARDYYVRKDGSVTKPGDRVFAKEVLHPGSPGQHMLAIGQHMTEAEFEQIADPALNRWARDVEAEMRRL